MSSERVVFCLVLSIIETAIENDFWVKDIHIYLHTTLCKYVHSKALTMLVCIFLVEVNSMGECI